MWMTFEASWDKALRERTLRAPAPTKSPARAGKARPEPRIARERQAPQPPTVSPKMAPPRTSGAGWEILSALRASRTSGSRRTPAGCGIRVARAGMAGRVARAVGKASPEHGVASFLACDRVRPVRLAGEVDPGRRSAAARPHGGAVRRDHFARVDSYAADATRRRCAVRGGAEASEGLLLRANHGPGPAREREPKKRPRWSTRC
jgi:hypothetical protein